MKLLQKILVMDLLHLFTCLDFPSYKDRHHDVESEYLGADLVNDAVVDAQETSEKGKSWQ